jgi:hypothetical protein
MSKNFLFRNVINLGYLPENKQCSDPTNVKPSTYLVLKNDSQACTLPWGFFNIYEKSTHPKFFFVFDLEI